MDMFFLGDNKFTVVGCKSLASALETNQTLQELDICTKFINEIVGRVKVGTDGAKAFAESLLLNKVFNFLYIGTQKNI